MIRVKPFGWPWQIKERSALLDGGSKIAVGQKWGWKLYNGGMGRFGGGWHWKLGIEWGGASCIVYLVIGGLRLYFKDESQ